MTKKEQSVKSIIMIVDDDPGLRVMLQQMLAFRGFEVIEAEDGVEALKKAAFEPLDAIVLDVMMPGLDGIAVCRKMRQNPKLINTPIIMLSGKATPEAIQVGLAAGATKYLGKPISMPELIREIKSVLSVKIP